MVDIDKLYDDAKELADEIAGENGLVILITKKKDEESKTLYGGDGIDILYALAGVLIRMSDELEVPYTKTRQVFNAILSDAIEHDAFTFVEDLFDLDE